MKKALLLIDVQKGFLSAYWGKRNNPMMEQNISDLLQLARQKKWEIIHVQHLSLSLSSPLRPLQEGAEFMEIASPWEKESVVVKRVNSAFIGTNLEDLLSAKGIKNIVMAGFTTDHCVSTSARMAANLGHDVSVIADACATFERSFGGINYDADLIHNTALASLEGEFAKVKELKNLS